MPRSTLASAAVVGGWLLLNLAAYGALVVPDNSEESLLARRSVQASAVGRVESLPNTPFFGRAPVKATTQQPEVDLANIPITQLNLVLSGVLNNSAKDKASALVAEKGKPAQRVYIGDSLPGGAELYSVAVDHIVLRRNGKMEKLTYPDEDGRPSVPMRQIANYARQAVEASASSAASSSEKQQSIRERLEELRELARERRAARRN
ncbi:type II secretion system protein N [Microbulbifer sp.]|uniref:type II secretion system protein N n=1 Tax=Microbulbifer sp. TaxID=1908541 RepID=UPI003F392887